MKLTPEKKGAFCHTLAETCNVGKAAETIGVSRYTVYKWRKDDPKFADAWDAALEAGVLAMEDEARRRAFDGTLEPVFHQGVECGTVRKYSDTLAIFLLKAHAPDKYRENHHRLDLGNADDKPFEVAGEVDRAARIASLVATAEARKAAEEDEGEDLA